MKVYWFLFIATIVISSISYERENRRWVLRITGIEKNKKSLASILACFVPTIIFLGLRSEVGDTIGYIRAYKTLSTEFGFDDLDSRAYGFSVFQRFCKAYISESPYFWLTLLVFISIILIACVLSRYSVDVRISLFVFFASTEFTFLLNGARQFIAVCICFFAFKYIDEKKPIKFYLLVGLAVSFHLTAIVMIPAYLVARLKPWSLKMYSVILGAALCCVFSESVFGIFNDTVLSDSVYAHYASKIVESGGVKILRVLVMFVPVVLAWYKRKIIASRKCNYINCCINLSTLNALVFLFASTMGGNLTGRMAEFFTIFNLILYPYLFVYGFKGREKKILKISFVIAYLFFFVYQMHIAWGGLEYVSEVLGIYLR